MTTTSLDAHCSTLRAHAADMTVEQLRATFDAFASLLKETNDPESKSAIIEHIISPLINLPYKTNAFAESTLIAHELFLILRDDAIIAQFRQRQTGTHTTHKHTQLVSVLFMNVIHKMNEDNVSEFHHLLFHQPLIDELANCLHEIGTYGQHLTNITLLRSIKSLLLTYKNYLRHTIIGDEYTLLLPILNSVIQCLCSSYAVRMIKTLKHNFTQKLTDPQALFLDTLPFYLQWYFEYEDPENYGRILRVLLNEFTQWFTNCPPQAYITCTQHIGRMIRHLNYFLVRPVESENVHIFSEEFYHDYCKLVAHWSLILSTTLPCFPDEISVKDSTRIIIKNLYNFTLHLNVLNYMKTMPNLIPMLLKVTDIEDDEIQVNAYRCLGKIMTEADIKTMTNPSQIASVYIDFITNTIDDPYQKERFHSLLKSLKNFVQHDQVKTELIELKALPLLVKCVVETQYDPIKVQQISLEMLLALSFNTEACSFLRQNQSFIDHIRALTLNTDPDKSGLQRAAEGLLWKLEEEEKAVAKPSIANLYKYDIMISYSHKDQQICLQIHEQLVKDGFQVWFDRDCLRGSTMVGIANAIENSKHVLICMSNTYKQSVYCHSEAHYAFERGCRLIPIVIEPNYKPDGWLGIIVSGKIYVDFGNVEFHLAYEKLKNEINEQEHHDLIVSPVKPEDKDSTEPTVTYSESSDTSYQSIVALPKCITEWTCDHVKLFFQRNGLSNTFLLLFPHIDGHRLLQLYEMCLSNRESMYQSLKFELNERYHTLLPIADYLSFLHEMKAMTDYIEERFTVISPRFNHKLSCIFHRKTSPYVDDQNREHVVILCHGYLANKNAAFLPELSRGLSDSSVKQFHSVRFDFHGCGESTGREEWDYGGYEDEAKDDLRSIVEYLRSQNNKYFVRALVGHSRAGTTVLLYALYFDDIPLIVNVAGRYRLERGINDRFSKKQLDELDRNGSFVIHTLESGDFRITKQGIERRKNLDIDKIDQIRHARVLNIWGDQDDVMPGDDIYLFNEQLAKTKKTEMVIVPDADHCFKDTEKKLIDIIKPWLQQSIE
ncbi:unnamed protein product [Adineta ricciae]|nr:unnamed protein product [Adineta ricciae]